MVDRKSVSKSDFIPDEEYTSKEIAEIISVVHNGMERTVTGIAPLNDANDNDLTFCKYNDLDYINSTESRIIICPTSINNVSNKTLLQTENPRTDFIRAFNILTSDLSLESNIHPTAEVDPEAIIGDNCTIGPGVVIGSNVTLGDNCVIQAGTTIGQSGFGYGRDEDGDLHHMPHIGEVIIEDNVEIGSNCTIDRGVFDNTVIKSGAKISSQVHLAHHSFVGSRSLIAYQSGLSGGVEIGSDVMLHPHCTIATDVSIGNDSTIGMNSTVLSDIPPGKKAIGNPAEVFEDS